MSCSFGPPNPSCINIFRQMLCAIMPGREHLFWECILAVLLLVSGLAPPVWALSAPTISPSASASATPVSVTMTAASGTIYYTLNGTQPTDLSIQYTGAITIDSPTQINAVAFSSPSTYSTVSTAYIDVEPGIAPVVANGVTPILWLRSFLGVSTASGNPMPVSSWIDLTDSGNSGTASYGAYPSLLTGAIEGYPSVSFNGQGQFLQIPSGLANFTSGATFFIVTEPAALTANARILDLGDAATGNNILFQISSSGSLGQFSTYSGASGTNAQSASALTSGQYQLLEAVLAPGTPNATGTFYVNGVAGTANTSMNNIPNTARTNNYLGQASSTGNFYDGSVVEVIAFSSNLTSSKREAIEAMLMQRYGILAQTPETPTISVPTGTLLQPTQVMISAEPDAVTTYTTNGSTPTASSPVYFGCPITINYTQTLKVASFKNGVSSGVASATYTLDSTLWPAPSPTDMTTPSVTIQLPSPSI